MVDITCPWCEEPGALPLPELQEPETSFSCPECGTTYYDFQKSGRLGCGKCYETFSRELSELLRKIHGSDKHVGKMPFMGDEMLKEQEDLQRLKSELKSLIQGEEFEKAAVLRDRIRDLEGKLKG